MFKKIIISVIFFCYLLSVTGATIDKFYCCGKLKHTSIFFHLEQKGNCDKKMFMKKGCCHFDKSFYKVKDSHQLGHIIDLPLPIILEISNNFQYDLRIKNCSTKISEIPFANGPPIIHTGNPLFLLNNNFRI